MRFHIENMECGGCAKGVRAAVLDLDADAKVDTDPASRLVEIATSAAPEAVQAALAEAGFPATVR